MAIIDRRYGGYAFAVAACLIAAVMRWLLSPLLGDRAQFFTFVLAVLVTARYGGFKPGLLASVLGGLLGTYFFLPPVYSFQFADYGAVIFVTLYFLISITASWLSGSLFTAQQRSEAKQRELENAEQALRDADRRKNEFLATLAHELRNPLAPLQNAVHILREVGSTQPEVAWCEGVIGRQVEQLARLLGDLLDVSRIAHRKLELRKALVDLAKVIDDALELSRPIIEARGHALRISLPPEPIFLDADAARLAQVLSNLLNNAAKYTPDGGQISLTAQRQGSDVAISIKDSGIGIDSHTLPRIFDMFSQATPALERSEGGLGIGLSLVKGLVELHDGFVEARSDGPGKGSEFIVHLPLQVRATYPPPSAAAVVPTKIKRRILVADDNRDAADSLAKMLKLMGHEVHTAYDGQQAVDQAEVLRPELILLDIGMPKLNGYDAARRLRQQEWCAATQLIALTGWGQEQDIRLAREAGFDHHLLKPLEATALTDLLSGLTPRPPTKRKTSALSG